MDHNLIRLQIAARIHFFLKRELGTGIDVETMLKRSRYAGEVLALCDRCKGSELEELARRFRAATAAAEHAGHIPRPQPWSADTSGFGLTQPHAAPAVTPAPPRSSATARRPR